MQEPTTRSETEGGSHAPDSIRTLQQAMRRARVDNAERAGVVTDLRGAQIGRLEMLQEALKPLLQQIPADVDLFDVGLMPSVTPRLFIDMIGFVEMGREARIYHFFQDTRHGRVQLAETSEIGTMVEAVTDYIARRLLERDKALADGINPQPRTVVASKPPADRPVKTTRGPLRWLAIAFAFLIDLLGSIAFFTIVAAIAWVVWNKFHVSM